MRTVRLQSLDFFDEPGERHGFSLDQVVIGFLDYLGHDQVDVQFIELGELGMGHVAGSQGEQVFVPDPVGFVGDLAETILDGCFRGEHTQLFLGERRILVGGLRGEQEIGFLSVFRLGLRLVFDAARTIFKDRSLTDDYLFSNSIWPEPELLGLMDDLTGRTGRNL